MSVGKRTFLNRNCYFFSKELLAYNEAQEYCKLHAFPGTEGRLYEPRHVDKTFNIIQEGSLDLVSRTGNWLVGVEREDDVFVYNSDGKELSFDQWGENQPMNTGDCVTLQDHTLFSLSCATKSFFICEIPPTLEGELTYAIQVHTGMLLLGNLK